MDSFSLLAHSGTLADVPEGARIFVVLAMLLVILFWVWSLVDALSRNNFKNTTEKLVWVFVIIQTFFLGTILYYFLGKKR